MRLLSIVVVALAASGCSSLHRWAVPGCPHCGDPVTHVGPDGRAEVVPRWRLAAWMAIPETPAAATQPAVERAAEVR
jgi:hypothetical protein